MIAFGLKWNDLQLSEIQFQLSGMLFDLSQIVCLILVNWNSGTYLVIWLKSFDMLFHLTGIVFQLTAIKCT